MGRTRPIPGRRRVALGLAMVLALSGCRHPGTRPLATQRPTAAAPVAAGATNGRGVPLLPPLPFTDVPDTFWAAQAIRQLAHQGVLRGSSPGRFSPAAPVSRAAYAALLAQVRHAPAGVPGPHFVDIPAGAWYGPAVRAVTGLGWMQGAAPGRFWPAAPISRAAAVTAAVAALGLARPAVDLANAHCHFADCARFPPWARGAIIAARDLGLVRGGSRGNFHASQPLDRAAAATLLDRLVRLPAASVRAVADRAARSIWLGASVAALAPNGSVRFTANVHDAAGYLLPATVQWSVSGPARVLARGTTTLTLRATGPGQLRVKARVPGEGAAAAAAIPSFVPTALALADLPPAGLAGTPPTVQVTVLRAGGVSDPAATLPVTLTARAAGRTVATATVRTQDGRARLPLPTLPAGSYTLRLTAPGVATLRVPYKALTRPLGAVQPHLRSGSVWSFGTRASLRLGLPPGHWPIAVHAVQAPAGLASVAPSGPPVVRVQGIRTATSGQVAARLQAAAPGMAALTVSVVGGALTPAVLHLRVRARGTFGPAVRSRPRSAGSRLPLRITVPSGTTHVAVQPVDPAGHALPWIAAGVHGRAAQAMFTPDTAGVWRLRWRAPGLAPVDAGRVVVVPGPPVRLVVDPTPTGVLLPGQTAVLRAWLADAYGNPVAAPLQLHVRQQGIGGHLHWIGGTVPGPGEVGSFRATAPGTVRLTVSAIRHAVPGSATVVLRTVPNAAARVAGKGMWLTFPDWRNTPDHTLLALARKEGITHLYLEVATSSDGFYGGRALDNLLPRAHADGIAVVAWVYVALAHPSADRVLVRQVAHYRTPLGDQADGIALDIEDHLQPQAVAAVARTADQAVGPHGLVVGITWAPQQKPNYPFRALAGRVNVLAPMDYWHVLPTTYPYASVYDWVRQSVTLVRRDAGLPTVPVEVIAETFDWFSNSGRGRFSPNGPELAAALRAASDAGAIGVSFYRGTTATPAEQAVIQSHPWPPAGVSADHTSQARVGAEG